MQVFNKTFAFKFNIADIINYRKVVKNLAVYSFFCLQGILQKVKMPIQIIFILNYYL